MIGIKITSLLTSEFQFSHQLLNTKLMTSILQSIPKYSFFALP
ncbi:MAG: hypothetical protein ACJAVH_001214, partial [Bacteroidia bacterium]